MDKSAEFRSAPPDCTDCELSTGRTQVVYPDVFRNSEDSIITFVIGEAPGKNEDEQGIPFVGASGKILRKKLAELPGTVIISNTCKCRPPDNRDPKSSEKQACRPYLMQEIEHYKPHLFILTGRHAAISMLGSTLGPKKDIKFTELSGLLFQGKYVPILHPASILYNRTKNLPIWEQSWKNIHEYIHNIDPEAKPISNVENKKKTKNLQNWLLDLDSKQ